MITAGCQSGNREQDAARGSTFVRHALANESTLHRLSLYDPYLGLCLYRLLPAGSSSVLLQPHPPREGQSPGSICAPMHVLFRDLAIVDR